MSKFAKILFLALLVIGCSEEPQPKPTTPLVIKTDNGDIRFMVEVAQTPEELKTGLMNRDTLGFNSGMIFNIYPVRPTAMWMKNTKIPLDMVFVAPDATVSMVKENAVPMSEELIISRDPVRAVIELNAGQVKRHGIKVGDKVSHMILNGMLDIKDAGSNAAPAPNAVPAANAQAENKDIPVPNLDMPPMKGPMNNPPMKGPMANPPMKGPMANPPMKGPMANPPIKGPMPSDNAAAPKLPVPAPM